MRSCISGKSSAFGTFVLLIWTCSSIHAECWSWTTKTLPGTPQSGLRQYGSLMTYDENLQKLVLLNIDDQYVLTMWSYDGISWNPIWSGPPPPNDGWHGWAPLGMYFDQNIKAIIVFGATTAADYYPYYDMFKFDPISGWSVIGGGMNYGFPDCLPRVAPAVTYNTARKRAVITGFGDAGPIWSGPPITLEFDGTQFLKISNPPDMTMNYGSIGYDPGSGKTVFYGYGRNCWSEKMETFEYDGQSWILVDTKQRPFTDEGPLAGLIYSPELNGLIAVPSESGTVFQTWLYKNSEWQQIPLGTKMPDRELGVLGFDNARNVAAYWGGRVFESDGGIPNSKDTLELQLVKHCRPLAKP